MPCLLPVLGKLSRRVEKYDIWSQLGVIFLCQKGKKRNRRKRTRRRKRRKEKDRDGGKEGR